MSDWKDLAPEICRQRIVIEGTLHNPFKAEDMDRYCREMTHVLNMTRQLLRSAIMTQTMGGALTFTGKSGMHVYAWDDRKPCFFLLMFTLVEPLTQKHQKYTKEFFGDDLIEIT